MPLMDFFTADCETCPTPHSICDFTGCLICGACPAAQARWKAETQRRQREANDRHATLTAPPARGRARR